MARLHLLGTGAALSDARRTTTMLAVEGDGDVLLVDCGGDAVQRLLVHGLALESLNALIVTHEHADHVSGFPLLLERLWLAGRRQPLSVYGIAPAVAQARRSHDAFDTGSWPGYAGARYVEVAHEPGAAVLANERWRVSATPGVHSVPTVGLRIEDLAGGGVVAYSGDTGYAPDIVASATGADVLVHEASDLVNAAGRATAMHSRPVDAAQVAKRANVGRLVLVHLPPGFESDGELVAEARAIFPALTVGEDGAIVEF